MSLATILGIDSSRFSYEELLAMQHAERRWVDVGKPGDCRRLAELLRSVINDCDSSILQFPPIFLELVRTLRCRTLLMSTPDRFPKRGLSQLQYFVL
jgi:hypothetical protein